MADNERSTTLTPTPYFGVITDDSGNGLVGAESLPRLDITANTGNALTSQVLRLQYFTPKAVTPPITKIITYTGTTAAAATPTIGRVGIYTIDLAGNGTLVASCANDTSMWAATGTEYPATITGPSVIVLQPGQRYAAACLVVTGVAPPTLLGAGASSAVLLARAPRLTGQITAQADLPATFTAGSVTGNAAPLYFGFSAS